MKVVIFAPFWTHTNHVGVYRVDRFVRWLNEIGSEVVVVCHGSDDRVSEKPWGHQVAIRDPIGFYVDSVSSAHSRSTRRPNRLRRSVATMLFCPDPGIAWARRAGRHKLVMERSRDAAIVLSSSPPESAHVGAGILAQAISARQIIDMRDGWLDEPLKPNLRSSSMRRWREGRVERALMCEADRVFVTSSVWRDLLLDRLRLQDGKVIVLTNAYPPIALDEITGPISTAESESLVLLHAGRFTGSRLTQTVESLLAPILSGIPAGDPGGVIELLGQLEERDIQDAGRLRGAFESRDWSIRVLESVSRPAMMQKLRASDGLLLLSASPAPIPSKLFEYLPTGKPILAVTQRDSAVWRLGERIEQIFLVDNARPHAAPVVEEFFRACRGRALFPDIPSCFSEASLSQKFLESILPGYRTSF